MLEIHNDLHFSRAISPAAAVTDNTAIVTTILDVSNFAHNELVVSTGSLADADATFTLLLEEGNDPALADHAAVAAADLLGTMAGASFTFADDDKVFKIGYKGNKKYIRATITPANNTGNAFVSGIWAQAGARVLPQS